MNINVAIVGGRLTRDPESTTSSKGRAITEFSLAINRSFTGENNRIREETAFVDVVCWARLAEAAAEFCQKGSEVMVRGRLQLDQWEAKETGAKRSKLRVVAETIDFLDQKTPEAKETAIAAAEMNDKPKRRARREDALAVGPETRNPNAEIRK